MTVKISRCLVCNGNAFENFLSCDDPDHIAEHPFQLFRCRDCGLFFVNPQPSTLELEPFYRRPYYRTPPKILRSAIAAAVSLLQSYRNKKILREKKGGRILDVGCGNGDFLVHMAQRGWEAFGIEPSPAGTALARQQGLKIYDRALPDCELPANYFDVVTLWHSLEHLNDPRPSLEAARRTLRDDGLLFLAVPNGGSLEFRLFGRHWFHLDLPRHLFHYSPDNLARLLKRAGFRLARVDYKSWEYNPFGFYQSVLNLLSTEPNFLYKKLKGIRIDNIGIAATVWNAFLIVLTAPVLLPGCLLYSFLSAAAGRSGCINIYAIKNAPSA